MGQGPCRAFDGRYKRRPNDMLSCGVWRQSGLEIHFPKHFLLSVFVVFIINKGFLFVQNNVVLMESKKKINILYRVPFTPEYAPTSDFTGRICRNSGLCNYPLTIKHIPDLSGFYWKIKSQNKRV